MVMAMAMAMEMAMAMAMAMVTIAMVTMGMVMAKLIVKSIINGKAHGKADDEINRNADHSGNNCYNDNDVSHSGCSLPGLLFIVCLCRCLSGHSTPWLVHG